MIQTYLLANRHSTKLCFEEGYFNSKQYYRFFILEIPNWFSQKHILLKHSHFLARKTISQYVEHSFDFLICDSDITHYHIKLLSFSCWKSLEFFFFSCVHYWINIICLFSVFNFLKEPNPVLNVMAILDTFRKMYVCMIQKFSTEFQRNLTRDNIKAWSRKVSRLFKLDLLLTCFFFS